jgi:hypothetical protein
MPYETTRLSTNTGAMGHDCIFGTRPYNEAVKVPGSLKEQYEVRPWYEASYCVF